MRILHNILLGIVLAGLLFAASCNLGNLEDDPIDLNLPHDEGGGGDV